MARLKIANLKKSFGATTVLHDIDLDVKEGEFVSLLGASGSGKTTLLRCLAGLEIPDSGEIHLGNRPFFKNARSEKPEDRDLGMVFQNYAVWPHLTVRENVAFPFQVRRRGSAEDARTKVEDVLRLVKLEHLAHRYPHELSGGQQQRVALARALVIRPQALLLDEPLSNLDAVLREELGAEIRRLQQQLRLTTILVTHDRREALSLSDRIVVLNKGKIEANGSPENLYETPPTPFIASFISGAQTIQVEGQERQLLPRRWRMADSDSRFRILSRVYYGNEYEYWAENPSFSEPIRFYARDRFELEEQIALVYDA